MKDIEDKSIDMVLCDLPYGITRCKWDSVIPLDNLWKQYKRIIKDNGAIVLFGAEPFSSELRLSNLKWYKYDWIWQKPKGTGHLNAKKQPLRDVENISVFYKKQCTYNPQFTKGEPYKRKGGKNPGECYNKYNSFRTDNDGVRYPRQVLNFKVVGVGNVHPTQKPLPLLEYLIRTYTNEGETVLDNCMGSGSTGVACKNLNRNFIGIELDETYFKIAENRVFNDFI